MILVAIGANLSGPDGAGPLVACAKAAVALADLPGLRMTAMSRWYETTPVPRSDQPNYVNGVARLESAGTVDPRALLAALHAIEQTFGRQRGQPNAARTLDLDLIDLDGMIRDSPDPILPHPRAHERAFVLLPLRDVAPDWRHPVNGLTVTALLAAADQSGVTMMSASDTGGLKS